jgi:cytidylate kinase
LTQLNPKTKEREAKRRLVHSRKKGEKNLDAEIEETRKKRKGKERKGKKKNGPLKCHHDSTVRTRSI